MIPRRSLHTHIKEKNWDVVLKILSSSKAHREARQLKPIPVAGQNANQIRVWIGRVCSAGEKKSVHTQNKICLPLYLACAYKAPVGIIKRLLEVYPEATKVAASGGWLPIHHLCRYPENDTLQLLELFRETLNAKTDQGFNPLHCACSALHNRDGRSSNAYEIIKFLTKFCPRLINKADHFGCLPIYYACRADGSGDGGVVFDAITLLLKAGSDVRHINKNEETLLHCVTMGSNYHTHTKDVVRLLLDEDPDAAKKRDRRGYLPIHCSCDASRKQTSDVNSDDRENVSGLEIVKMLLDAFPNSAKEELKMQDSSQPVSSTPTKLLPLHLECWKGPNARMEVIKALHQANPQAVQQSIQIPSTTHNCGVVHLKALHIACYRGAPPNVIGTLIDSHLNGMQEEAIYPEVSRNSNHQANQGFEKSPPHIPIDFILVQKATHQRNLQIEEILKKCPELVRKSDKNGRLLLHKLCIYRYFSLPVVRSVVDKFPRAVMEKDKWKKHPKCYCFIGKTNGQDIWRRDDAAQIYDFLGRVEKQQCNGVSIGAGQQCDGSVSSTCQSGQQEITGDINDMDEMVESAASYNAEVSTSLNHSFSSCDSDPSTAKGQNIDEPLPSRSSQKNPTENSNNQVMGPVQEAATSKRKEDRIVPQGESFKCNLMEAILSTQLENQRQWRRMHGAFLSLAAGTKCIPTKFVLVKEQKRKDTVRQQITSFTHRRYKLHFLCSHDNSIVPSPLDIKVRKWWMTKLAPVIDLLLKALNTYFSVQGVGVDLSGVTVPARASNQAFADLLSAAKFNSGSVSEVFDLRDIAHSEVAEVCALIDKFAAEQLGWRDHMQAVTEDTGNLIMVRKENACFYDEI